MSNIIFSPDFFYIFSKWTYNTPSDICEYCGDILTMPPIESSSKKVVIIHTECNHVFHEECIDKLKRSLNIKSSTVSCPTCNTVIIEKIKIDDNNDKWINSIPIKYKN